jgi:hypothetical protein
MHIIRDTNERQIDKLEKRPRKNKLFKYSSYIETVTSLSFSGMLDCQRLGLPGFLKVHFNSGYFELMLAFPSNVSKPIKSTLRLNDKKSYYRNLSSVISLYCLPIAHVRYIFKVRIFIGNQEKSE